MQQYLVTGYDFTDEGAIDRRLKIRPLHIENIKTLKAANNYVIGGAMLNEEGNMIGSTMILQFENKQDLENWKSNEPYILEHIWEKVEIKPFRVAQV